ncbi:WhiB family transcriptional regulator [Nocardia sp. NPDC052001]|uniref:WhiB family transcriptional regulator n=1 Tax=Nocardia sp. NPDC052001 TaxID=3154853 RepID=UPI003423A5D1
MTLERVDTRTHLGGNAFRTARWVQRAVCAQTDPESFFPERGQTGHAAKKVCARCGVSRECLEYALAHEERFGIWGGLSPNERCEVNARW